MKKPLRIALSVLLASALLGNTLAQADDDILDEYTKDTWPLEVTKRPLTLAKGMLEFRGDTFMLNLSDEKVGKPFSFAPDIYYGVDSKLSIGLTHDTGICLAGDADGDGCEAGVYNDFGLDVLYGVMIGGSFQFALHGGFGVPSIDPFIGGLNIGGLARLQAGNIALVLDPRLYVGLAGRSKENAPVGVFTEQGLDVPVWVQFQVNAQTAIFARTGMIGPLEDFGENYVVPLGLGAVVAANNRVDFGLEFLLPMVAGNRPDGVDAIDTRWLIARAALRL